MYHIAPIMQFDEGIGHLAFIEEISRVVCQGVVSFQLLFRVDKDEPDGDAQCH